MRNQRQIRRAEERRLRKAGRKTNGTQPVNPETIESNLASLEAGLVAPEPAVSAAQQAANQRNAQLSTGPRTPEGKRRSSLNAVRTGLTGKTVLLATDDADAYTDLCRRFRCDWFPASERELELVQMMADTQWRLNRIPALEAALLAAGRIAFTEFVQSQFPNQDPQLQAALLDIHIQTTYERHFRNLHLQESRLRRYYRAAVIELEALQKERRKQEAAPQAESEPDGFVFADLPQAAPESLPNHRFAAETGRLEAIAESRNL